jgi:hypothetical protein
MASVERGIDAALRNQFKSERDFLFTWLLICTAIVALGVVLEEAELWLPSGKPRLNMVTGDFSAHPLIKWQKRVVKIGWVLIVVGVIGEGLFEATTSIADGELQDFGTILLEDAQNKAGTAKDSSLIANEAANRATKKAQSVENIAKYAQTESLAALASADRAEAKAENVGNMVDEAEASAKRIREIAECLRLQAEYPAGNSRYGPLRTPEYDPLTELDKGGPFWKARIEYEGPLNPKDDLEPSTFANIIACNLRSRDWKLEGDPVNQSPSPVGTENPGIGYRGVTIFVKSAPLNPENNWPIPFMEIIIPTVHGPRPEMAPWYAYFKSSPPRVNDLIRLAQSLHANVVDDPDPDLPEGTMRIRVRANPAKNNQ